MFKQQKGKNAFLLKKNQEKQKAQQQLKSKQQTLKLQKTLRGFIHRRRLAKLALANRNIRLSLLLRIPLEGFSHQEIMQFIQRASCDILTAKQFYLSRFVLGHIETQAFFAYCVRVLSDEHNEDIRQIVFSHVDFVKALKSLLMKGQAARLLDLSAEQLERSGTLDVFDGNLLLQALLHQFSEGFVQIESPYGSTLRDNTLQILVRSIAKRKKEMEPVSLSNFAYMALHILKVTGSSNCPPEEDVICFCLTEFMRLGATRHEEITKELVKENQHLIALVEDQDLMEELEAKLRSSEMLEEFTNDFLGLMERVMTNPQVLAMFEDPRCKRINHTLLAIIGDLSVLFEDRRLIFVRQLISSDAMLRSLAGSQDPMFYEGLKMRLLAMDDQQFIGFDIFQQQEWQRVVDNCVGAADVKILKLIERMNVQQVNGEKLIPFKKRNSDQLQLKTIVDLLNNLYKKSLRTKKLNPEVFVSYSLSAALQGFLFGKGARRVQMLLRELPFVFSFESRMRKLKEFVKEDKKNYDRSLFLQQEVDEDLIIAVRRGNEFQDAYEACMSRDLRKKYKIIFFNQQGLEEEGVDGGGIIKQFINRVLKASFSETYGLFMETSRHQILPDPYSPFTSQYEFVGRLVGKAVYEGINIQQKFAQPFLNLVIGRQNTFEDLQFVDPDVYRGLISIKHSKDDISVLEQTFVIYDKLPNGKSKYVDLLCPAKAPPPSHRQVQVTNQNKMQFIMNYADYKCNKQIEEKTRLFRRGFLKVMKPEWLTMFSNQQLNAIISGDNPDFSVEQLRDNTVYNEYHEKDQTILAFWQVLKEMNCQEKSLFLLYVTSCSRPPTLGFSAMKPKMCISKDNNTSHLPTANTCMNVLRLPNYKNKALLRSKLLYAINAKAGFQFA